MYEEESYRPVPHQGNTESFQYRSPLSQAEDNLKAKDEQNMYVITPRADSRAAWNPARRFSLLSIQLHKDENLL